MYVPDSPDSGVEYGIQRDFVKSSQANRPQDVEHMEHTRHRRVVDAFGRESGIKNRFQSRFIVNCTASRVGIRPRIFADHQRQRRAGVDTEVPRS